jgi:hypothetical protein
VLGQPAAPQSLPPLARGGTGGSRRAVRAEASAAVLLRPQPGDMINPQPD